MKKRLDVYLVEKGIAGGRDAAKRLIAEGKIYVNGTPAQKAGQDVENAEVELKGEALRYVSRGGLKLEKAVKIFGIDLKGVTAADVGASSGGFTDCMLQHGAGRVYAVDVGHGQLAQKLKDDSRVIDLEGTDVRSLKLDEKVDFVSIDVAFISLRLVLGPVRELVKDGGTIMALIKPQFEAGRADVGKKGVVKDNAVRARVIEEVTSFAQSIGLEILGLDFSPIRGPEGNIEYLMYAANRPGADSTPVTAEAIRALVERSVQGVE